MEAHDEGLDVRAEEPPKQVSEKQVGKASVDTSKGEDDMTRFLALSKPGGNRDFLQVRRESFLQYFKRQLCSSAQIVDIPDPVGFARPISPPLDNISSTVILDQSAPGSIPNVDESKSDMSSLPAPPSSPVASPPRYRPTLYFDPHWLSIVRTFAPYLSLRQTPIPFPPPASFDSLIDESLAWIKSHVGDAGMKKVDEIQLFAKTAPASGEGRDDGMREFSIDAWSSLFLPPQFDLIALMQL